MKSSDQTQTELTQDELSQGKIDLNGIISLNGHDGNSFLPIPWLESWAVRGDKLMMRDKP